jgi:hypothetical protein
MPISYAIDPLHALLEEVWVGEIFTGDIRAHWQGVMQDPVAMNLRRSLVDLRKARFRLAPGELRQLVEGVILPHLGLRDWTSAIVLSSRAQLQSTAEYQAVAQIYSYDSIFSDMAMARSWLLRQHLRVE